jgi:hypothetical protein
VVADAASGVHDALQTTTTAMTPRDRRAFALVWLVYAVFVKAFWFVTDDAYISFRYARHWAEGHGLRYNLGEAVPVEGYSNFLWVALCAVVERLGGDVALWTPLVSFAAGSVLLWLVFRTLRESGVDLRASSLAALSMATFAPYFVWSTSGMETMALALTVFVAFERLLLRGAGPAPVAAGLAGLAAALVRVEGVAWAVLVGLCAAVSWRMSGRVSRGAAASAVVRYLGIVLAGTAAFVLWRHAYHGSWISNTAAAKVGMSGDILYRGFEYVATYVVTFLTPLLIVPAAVHALRPERRAVGLPALVMVLAAYGYAIAVGGDFMSMGRFLVPGIAFGTLLAGWWLGVLHRRSPRTATAAAAAAIVLALLPAADVHVVPEAVRSQLNFRRHWNKYWSEIQYWNVMRVNGARWKRLAFALRERADPDDAVVTPGIGNVGYWSELTIHDMAGLVDREVALRPGGKPTAPGHDKIVPPEFFLDREPEWILPHLVTEGGELMRTREALELARDKLWALGARYSIEQFAPSPSAAEAAGPRPPDSAERALLANLLAPLGPKGRSSGPREFILVLRRAP